jgi:prepilin-type N-terminal cleavage/methylation domain-containing protein
MWITECGVRNEKRGWMPDTACMNVDSKGFTLVEIVITIVIVSIISGIAAMIILQGIRSYSDDSSRSDVQYQTRFAVDRMAREIRLIRTRTIADIPTMNGTTLLYNDINGTRMGFRLNAGSIQRTQDNGATWQTLATNITGGAVFTYLDDTGAVTAAQSSLWLVQIQVAAAEGSESVTMRTTVHPRNF